MNQIKKPNDTSNKIKQKKYIDHNDLLKIIAEKNKNYSSYFRVKNLTNNESTQPNSVSNDDLNNIDNLISKEKLSFNISYINILVIISK